MLPNSALAAKIYFYSAELMLAVLLMDVACVNSGSLLSSASISLWTARCHSRKFTISSMMRRSSGESVGSCERYFSRASAPSPHPDLELPRGAATSCVCTRSSGNCNVFRIRRHVGFPAVLCASLELTTPEPRETPLPSTIGCRFCAATRGRSFPSLGHLGQLPNRGPSRCRNAPDRKTLSWGNGRSARSHAL
jgi:hypothetical protein